MGFSWEIYGIFMGFLWDLYGQFIGTLENHGGWQSLGVAGVIDMKREAISAKAGCIGCHSAEA